MQVARVQNYFFIRQLINENLSIFFFLTDLEKVIHVFISCRLDYYKYLQPFHSPKSLSFAKWVERQLLEFYLEEKHNDESPPFIQPFHTGLPFSFMVGLKILFLHLMCYKVLPKLDQRPF